MAAGERKDPYFGFRFLVEIQGLVKGGFSEASGLQVEVETEIYKEGGVNEYVHKLASHTSYANVVLKRGMTDADELWKWHQNVVKGKLEPKTIYVVVLDDQGQEKIRWNCAKAYPVKWVGPTFQAGSNVFAVETLELVHEGLKRG